MIFTPFLEAVDDYRAKKNLKDTEKKISILEATAAVQVGRVFRQQGEIIDQSLPDQFDEHDLNRAADKAELETYPAFKDVIIGTGLVAAKVGIRGLCKDLKIQDGDVGFTGYKISFDGFDEAAYQRLQNVAGQKITKINEETRKQIHEILTKDFAGELQPDGTRKFKSYQQIAKDIKDRFDDFAAAAPQTHIRNRAELVAITEIRDAYETSKHETSLTLESHGWELEKHWNNMGDSKVSSGCRSNTAVGWIPNNQSFPSEHMYPPRFPGCRCNVTRKVKGRKNQSRLPADRQQVVTPNGDETTVKRNPNYNPETNINDSGAVIPQKIVSPVSYSTNLEDITESFAPLYFYTRDDLSEEEKKALLNYQTDSSKVNGYLRGQYVPQSDEEETKLTEQIANISDSFTKAHSKLPFDVDVVKGIDFLFAKTLLDKGGVEDEAFLSTTYNLADAINYAQKANNLSPDHDGYLNIVAISLEKGTRFVYLKEDAEVLLDKGSNWIVIDSKEFESLTYVTNNHLTKETRKYNKVRILFIKREEGNKS